MLGMPCPEMPGERRNTQAIRIAAAVTPPFRAISVSILPQIDEDLINRAIAMAGCLEARGE